jgi:NAD(P)-dependent dehydrogenase (short-subunit alcohol dehydrogenase family)
MSSPTVYLGKYSQASIILVSDRIVTGAGRGIGFSLVEELANRPNSIVFASVRTLPLKPDEQLAILAAKYPGVVVPIKLTSGGEADNQAAARLIKDKVGKVDVIIACAGKFCLPLTPLLASLLSSLRLSSYTVQH